MNRQEALAKVLKLKKFTPENAEEAGTAAAFMQRLMDRFKLDEVCLNEALPEGERADLPIVTKRVYTFDGPRVVTWVSNLINQVAALNGCKLWMTHGGATAALDAAGTEDDLADVTYFATYLVSEIELLTKKAMKSFKAENGYRLTKTWSNSFRHGAVATVASRLREAKEDAKREARERAMNPEGVAKDQDVESVSPVQTFSLAVVDASLVKLEQRFKKAEEWANEKLRLRKSASKSSRRDGGAFAAGQAAGRSIDLTPKRGRLVG